MPGIAAVGVELSQWEMIFQVLFSEKYEEDIENAGSIYRTGLNLRYHVSDLSNDIQKYMDHLNDF
ncbi:MAG: hypothetical protein HS132_03065 [Planctomycetia bacterium]|nr:hypothetical protein [Planctomycetia bacterium]